MTFTINILTACFSRSGAVHAQPPHGGDSLGECAPCASRPLYSEKFNPEVSRNISFASMCAERRTVFLGQSGQTSPQGRHYDHLGSPAGLNWRYARGGALHAPPRTPYPVIDADVG